MTDVRHNFLSDLQRLPHLKCMGLALFDFARALGDQTAVMKKGNQWLVTAPFAKGAFVTFRVQPRNKNLKLYLRGNFQEFTKDEELTVNRDRAGSYSNCLISNARQLAAAALNIQTAFDICRRGRRRFRR